MLALCASPAHSKAPSDAPKLGRPKGRVVRVRNLTQLYGAIASLRSGTTLWIEKGTYELDRPLHIRGDKLEKIAIRGATGRYEDVVIRGRGMTNDAVAHGLLVEGVRGLLIADLTIADVRRHAVALHPGRLRGVHLYHCRFVDSGEQFVKGSRGKGAEGVSDGIVEYCRFEYTDGGPKGGYTNGVDVHGGANWIVRHNLFRDIRTRPGDKYTAVPAVLFWNGAKNTICESNSFIDCDRGVAFGLMQRDGFRDHEGGIIRNNLIVVDPERVPNADAGIVVWDSPGTKVLHNTIRLGGAYPNAIETRWKTSQGIEIAGNLCDAKIVARNGSKFSELGNRRAKLGKALKEARDGRPHLPKKAKVPRQKRHPDCPLDWDGAERPKKATAVGADEP